MTQPPITSTIALPPIRRLIAQRLNNGRIDMHRLECGHEVEPGDSAYEARSCKQCYEEGLTDD